jgi:hypothetical protein
VNEWAVTGFVSRVAERVASAGEGFAAQLTDRSSPDEDSLVHLTLRLPVVEPSPEFIEDLRQRLMNAPIVVAAPARIAFFTGSRIVYGVAAVGSLASAAVVVALILRSRGTNRAAA